MGERAAGVIGKVDRRIEVFTRLTDHDREALADRVGRLQYRLVIQLGRGSPADREVERRQAKLRIAHDTGRPLALPDLRLLHPRPQRTDQQGGDKV